MNSFEETNVRLDGLISLGRKARAGDDAAKLPLAIEIAKMQPPEMVGLLAAAIARLTNAQAALAGDV